MTPEDVTAKAAQDALELLIAYVRSNYAPTAPTRQLLAAYEAQGEELRRLRVEVAALRQCLALHNLEVEP